MGRWVGCKCEGDLCRACSRKEVCCLCPPATDPSPRPGPLCRGQTLHCGRTAGTCIKDHPKEKEGGNIKHADAATQHNNLILRCLKSVVLTAINPNCNYAKAYKRGGCSNDMCGTPQMHKKR